MEGSSLVLLDQDVGESYGAVARSAAAAVGAEACRLALYDAEANELLSQRPCYTGPDHAVPLFRFPLDAAPASAHVIRTGEPYVSNNPDTDTLYDPSVKEHGVRSILTVPIRTRGRIEGLLYAINKPGGFRSEDVQTLTALAGAAAINFHNIRLYAEERERRVLSESLCEVSRALVGNPAEDAGLAAVLDQMWRVVRYQAASAVVVEGARLRVAASRGGDVGVEIPLVTAGDLGEVLNTRQLGFLSDAPALLPALGLGGLVTGRALAAPLLAKTEVLGAFIVVFEVDHPLSLRDGQLASAFADHAALFLEAGAVLRHERQARTRAAALARITRIVATRHEPESLLQAVAPELLALSRSDRAVVYLVDRQERVLVPVTSAGTEPGEEERMQELRLDLISGPLAALAEDLKAVSLSEESSPPPTSLTAFPDTRSLLVVPLACRGELLGAVAFSPLGRRQTFDPALIDLLSDVGQQVALGVENARLFARLAQLASTDELTQLANRRRFIEAFHLELARSHRTGSVLSLLLADIDRLKKINDTYGHPAGDAAIRHVAEAIRRGRREIDLVARLGGEEFALILPGTDRVGAVKAAERIRRDLADSSIPPVGTVTVSMGVATCPDDGSSEETLVRTTDERLYAAKASGRNTVCYMSLPGRPGSAGGAGHGPRWPEP